MTEIIIVFAVLIFIAGFTILINPKYILNFFERNMDRVEIQVIAVVVRLLIGVLLFVQADLSKYPLTMQLLGIASIAAALALAAMGRGNFVKLMTWIENKLQPFARIGGILALVFGGFIIHAFT